MTRKRINDNIQSVEYTTGYRNTLKVEELEAGITVPEFTITSIYEHLESTAMNILLDKNGPFISNVIVCQFSDTERVCNTL